MDDKTLYRDEFYPKLLTKSLFEMRNSGSLCDVVLVCEGEIFAHRIVLASGSLYFRGMFTHGLKESKEERVEINCMNGIILRAVVDFIYTGEINISQEYVLPLLEASCLLQLGSLRSACMDKVLKTVNPYFTLESCGYLANKLGLIDLESLVHRVTIEKFQEVVLGDNKLVWLGAPYEAIRPLLGHLAIRSQPAKLVIEAAVEWILHDSSGGREVYLDDLLSHLACLDKCKVSKEVIDRLSSKPKLLEKFIPLMAAEDECHKSCSWKESQIVIAVGGFSGESALKTVECYLTDSPTSTPWTHYLPELPGSTSTYGNDLRNDIMDRVVPTMQFPRAFAASAFSDYEIFVVGGERHSVATNNEASMECYNIASNSWSLKPGIPLTSSLDENDEVNDDNMWCLRLVGSAAALIEGDLYVCGGRIERVTQHEKEVVHPPSKWIATSGLSKATWVYNQERNKWRQCEDMLQSRAYHGAASVNGVLYALGGIGLGEDGIFPLCLNSVERYDPWDGIWRNVKSMPSPRAYIGCVTALQCIYILGGHNLESCRDTVFKYDSFSDSWVLIEYPLPSPVDSLAVASMKYPPNSMDNAPFYAYLIGGRNSFNGLRHVNVYNFVTQRWHCLQSMIQERLGASVAVLRLPRNFNKLDKSSVT